MPQEINGLKENTIIRPAGELPGLNRFIEIQQGLHQEGEVVVKEGMAVAGSYWSNFKESIRNLVGQGKPDDVERLINWIEDGQITQDQEPVEITIKTDENKDRNNKIIITEKELYSDDAQAIIEVILEEGQEATRQRKPITGDEFDIKIDDSQSRTDRIRKLATALGVEPKDVQYENIEQLLTYLRRHKN